MIRQKEGLDLTPDDFHEANELHKKMKDDNAKDLVLYELIAEKYQKKDWKEQKNFWG